MQSDLGKLALSISEKHIHSSIYSRQITFNKNKLINIFGMNFIDIVVIMDTAKK